jgi:hypothetical protein
MVLTLLSRPASAVTIDGTVDPAYGPAIVQQGIQTNSVGGQLSGNSTQNDLNFANGSELDLGYALVDNGVLYLFLAGNVALMLNANQNGTVRHVLDLFVDAVPGGQNNVNGLGAGVVLNGLTFDTGFEADYLFELEGDDNGFFGPRNWTARYAALHNGGGGTIVNLGTTTAGGPGTLSGGTNPHGVLVTIDNRNTSGVGAGCAAGSGAGATLGVEWAIPLSAIGNATGCVRVIAFVRSGASLSNQVLASAPAGTCALGTASNVNFANLAGNQYFSVCPTTDVPGDRGAGIAMSLLDAHPSRGERLRVAFTLPDARPARLRLLDAGGRLVRDRSVGGAAGPVVVNLFEDGRPAPGVYWVRLTHAANEVTRKISVVR